MPDPSVRPTPVTAEALHEPLRSLLDAIWAGAATRVVVEVDDQRTVLTAGAAGSDPTHVQIGSISKVVAALACGLAAADGHLDLGDLMVQPRYAPRLFGTVPPLTYNSVLRHRTGLGVPAFPGFDRCSHVPDLEELVAGHDTAPPLAYVDIPFRRTTYSSGSFTLLEISLRDGLRTPFDALLATLLDRFDLCEAFLPDHAAGTGGTLGEGWALPHVPVPHGSLAQPVASSSGLWASPDAVVTLMSAISHEVRGGSGRFADLLRTEFLDTQGTRRMGLAAVLGEADGRLHVRQRGLTAGFRSEVLSYPWHGVHIAATATIDDAAPALTACIDAIDAIVWGRPTETDRWSPRADVSTHLRAKGEQVMVDLADGVLHLRTRWGWSTELAVDEAAADGVEVVSDDDGCLALRARSTILPLRERDA